MSNYIYGLDFGTSNSSLAILDIDKSEVVKVFTIPSLLFFPSQKDATHKRNVYVGQEAIDKYLDSNMQGRFMKSIKRILSSKSFTKTRIGNRYYKIEELVSIMVNDLKRKADSFVKETVNTVVMGRPVVFSENAEKDALAQERLLKAVNLSGFSSVFFQLEPIAAALNYERHLKQEELVLVGDFGGGTSDFTLMKLNPKNIHLPNRQNDMISMGGIYIGGDNFDSDLMWHKITPYFGRGLKEKTRKDVWMPLPLYYYHNICSWKKLNTLNTIKTMQSIRKSYVFSGKNPLVKNLWTLVEKNLGFSVFQEIEKNKINLTTENQSVFVFNQEDISIQTPITIEEFDAFSKNNLSKIEAYLDNYLATNNINNDDIDSVFLTGGTSMIRSIKNIFMQRFGEHKIKSIDNFNSVSNGLAYSYKNFNPSV